MVRIARSAGATYGGETEGVNLNTQGGHVLLLEFTSQVALDEGGLGKIVSAKVVIMSMPVRDPAVGVKRVAIDGAVDR